MLETAQPLHTFDLEKLEKLNGSNDIKITVRNAFDGEGLELLDGRKIKMTEKDIVIATGASGEIAIALAGAMGGISTAIDENTSKILVESATFNLYNLRNTQMRHGIFSEAITRFTKGIPEMLSRKVLDFFGERILAMGGKSLSAVADSTGDFYYNKSEISVSKDKINQVLGTEFSQEQIEKTLENVGVLAKFENPETFLIPFWRNDLNIEEDLIEEVGRLNGYDNIALRLPTRTFRGVDFSKFDKLQAEIRQILVAGGANEVLTYSFIHGDLLEKFGQNPENSYRIVNSISPDLQFYRQTLTPSLLSKVNQNIRGGFGEFAIFEMNKITMKSLGLTDEDVPNEVKNLALVYSSKKGENAFYQAKYFASYLFGKLGLKLEVCEFSDENQLYGGFEPKRSAYLGITMNGDFVKLGVLGEFKKSVQKLMKLPEATAGFEINLEKLCEIWGDKKLQMRKLSKFQSVERDLSLKFEQEISFGEVEKAFESAKNLAENIEIEISPIDIYEAENSKTISLRFKIIPFEKTLTGDEIREIVEKLEKIAEKLGAKIT
jgi:phenylalanyl-tRNA synthetase beta chain